MQDIKFDNKLPLIIYEYQIPRQLKSLHLHDCMEIGLILSGAGEFYIENKHYHFKAENIFLINKLEAHRAKTTSSTLSDSIFIYIDNSLIDKYARLTSNVNLLKLTMLYGDNITNMFSDQKTSSIIKDIWAIYNSKETYKNDIILAEVLKLLIHIYSKFHSYIERNEIDHADNYSILKAVDYINEHYTEKIYISDLSKICNFSQSYFSKKFKALLGKSPLDYVLSRRLKNSYILIRDKNMPASQAALLSGFDNYSNFLRKFKAEFNINPAELKKSTH